MTEIATTPRPFEAPVPAYWDGTVARSAVPAIVSKGERLREWLDLFVKTESVANVLARTQFVPKAMQGKPAEVAAAMMRSFEMGIEPLDGLGHMHVIGGKVGYSAELMRRRIIEAGHEIVFVESTDSRAVLKARRREHEGDESRWQTFTFTDENARKAKIDLGGYPADKLVARASSRMCRRMFPEVLAGVPIAEDLIDEAVIGGDVASLIELPEEMRPALTVGRAGVTVQRKRAPRAAKAAAPGAPEAVSTRVADSLDELLDGPATPPAPEPPAEPTPDADTPQASDITDDGAVVYEAAPADADAITKPQLQKLSILRQREGYADTDDGRADWFQWVSVNIGRVVGSNKLLTKAEASVLIDVLDGPEGQA